MRRLLHECPSCGSDLYISELSCSRCDIAIRGRFRPNRFERLDDENLRFVELFVACRGNVKQMERETGLGYWTIRGRLDEIIDLLGLGTAAREEEAAQLAERPPRDREAQRRQILEAVNAGELTVEEAEQMLRALKTSTDPRR